MGKTFGCFTLNRSGDYEFKKNSSQFAELFIKTSGNKMTGVTTINPSYSTTRTVTHQQPVIKKQAEDKFESVLFLPEGESRQSEYKGVSVN